MWNREKTYEFLSVSLLRGGVLESVGRRIVIMCDFSKYGR